MTNMISALVKRPGEPPRHINVSNSLEALQKNVEGYMADILIRGMEMPKNCSLCKLAQHRMLACSVMYPITGQTVGYYDEGFHQEDHICPLVQLPEGHGRFGDLDRLEGFLRTLALYQSGERQQGILGCCETIKVTPTIVPAEGGGE